MDPEYSLQDVVRCHLCGTPSPSLHCVNCHIHMCRDCEGVHLSNRSKKHKVVPFKNRRSTTICPRHSSNICELYCENCKFPLCVQCVPSKDHKGHEFVDIVEKLEGKKQLLQSDLKELEKLIYPKYKEVASNLLAQKADLNDQSQKLARHVAINKHKEDLHREIDTIINKLGSDLDDMDNKHLDVLNKHEVEITCIISEIKTAIAYLKKLLNSNDVGLVSAYKSRNAEFRSFHSTLAVSLPRLITPDINKEHIFQLFDSLSGLLSIKTEEYGFKMNSPFAESFPLDRSFIDVPQIITDINTKYEKYKSHSVSCMGEETIWTCNNKDNNMSLYNLQGQLLQSIETKSGNMPKDIAVTRSGDLVYTDEVDGTVNILINAQVHTLIRIQGRKAQNVCSTSSGDLLVVMYSTKGKPTKVVRYSGSTEKQSIQYDDEGQPLYSSGEFYKYICENGNHDICVSDNGKGAVVVVNQAGKLRFTYTGPPSTTEKPSSPCKSLPSRSHNNGIFSPYGITTDSLTRILIADHYSHRVHILDQDGQFLRYIADSHLKRPFGLCVDSRDILFVAECRTGNVKRIQYYM